eukprot:2484373-Amphidinium_carterae.1
MGTNPEGHRGKRFVGRQNSKEASELWGTRGSSLPSVGDCILSTRSLCFRVLSRLGSTLEISSKRVHSCYPHRVFKLLNIMSLATELLQDPPCVLDNFSLKLREKYPDFKDEVCQYILELQLFMGRLTSAQLRADMRKFIAWLPSKVPRLGHPA